MLHPKIFAITACMNKETEYILNQMIKQHFGQKVKAKP